MESFFGRVRCRLGCNTNPTTQQFTAAYKKLVLGACGKNFSISSNVIGQDETVALDVFSSKKSAIQYLEKKYDLVDDFEDEFESLDPTLTEFQDSAITYIAGFVKRKLQSEVKCLLCTEVINSTPSSISYNSLISRKDRGGLMYPSDDLIKICQVTESKIQDIRTNDKLFNDKQILHRINLKTVSTITTQYPGVYKHVDHDDHRYNLLKQTALIYSILRLKHLAREYNREEKPSKMRKKLSKLILFAHQ